MRSRWPSVAILSVLAVLLAAEIASASTAAGAFTSWHASSEKWALDTLGNWDELETNLDSDGTTWQDLQERQHNEANEIVEIIEGAVSPNLTYDHNGNLTIQQLSGGGQYEYTYDAWDRLVRVEGAGASHQAGVCCGPRVGDTPAEAPHETSRLPAQAPPSLATSTGTAARHSSTRRCSRATGASSASAISTGTEQSASPISSSCRTAGRARCRAASSAPPMRTTSSATPPTSSTRNCTTTSPGTASTIRPSAAGSPAIPPGMSMACCCTRTSVAIRWCTSTLGWSSPAVDGESAHDGCATWRVAFQDQAGGERP